MAYRIVKCDGEYSIEENSIGYETMADAEKALEEVRSAQRYAYGDNTNYKAKNKALMEEQRREDNEKVKRSYRLKR